MARMTLLMAENRMKMLAKETPWGKYMRLNELARHRSRCRNMKCTIVSKQRPQQKMFRERSDIEEVLDNASNFICPYKPGVKKRVNNCRPWCRPQISKVDPAPFSTLKIQPRDGKNLHIIEKNIMEHKQRIQKIRRGPSVYAPKKKMYLSRGEAPWHQEAGTDSVHTIDKKLKNIRKWAVRRPTKIVHPVPTGIMAYLPPFFSAPDPESKPKLISPVTEEDAKKSPELAQLKEVQEAGEP